MHGIPSDRVLTGWSHEREGPGHRQETRILGVRGHRPLRQTTQETLRCHLAAASPLLPRG
ncbi:hypothetical protein ACFFX0_22365 [Citricoccus parietis]|uniref:Uncharacterized protein n=1 Tax=Citricoccus parietis TaxID=592307 RepID=A0ABV5G4D4_9MICC